MPLYQYSCSQCGVIHEDLRSISERDYPLQCLQCGSNCMRNLFPGAYVTSCSRIESSALETPSVGPIAISITRPTQLTIQNCNILNHKRGIVAHERAQISMKAIKFRHVEVPVERRRG